MSNGTRNTTHQSLGNVREVCHILYIMTLCSRCLDLHLGGALSLTAQSRTKGTDALTHTFALICVLVKNCLCRYNFSIPEGEREKKKSYRSPKKILKNTNEHGCTHNGSRNKPRKKLRTPISHLVDLFSPVLPYNWRMCFPT